ncbi:uncharacterized protein LOC134514518 isoform X2 [Chroicocephalus ridibundus]|uniref:uncharacterized protein LOC134514518 isoform X2 n=1 Tax=Chroicocephalus ridibundus TaxID=1192867 RepID=UPI002FDC7ED2
MGLSVFSSVLQSKRLQKWWKKKKQHRTSKTRARTEKQSGDGGVEKSRPKQEKRASVEDSRRKPLSPWAPLATVDCKTDVGSSSFSSLYSFPEACPGGMAELSALDCSGPRHPPRAVKGRVQEPGSALCQEPPLELPTRTTQEVYLTSCTFSSSGERGSSAAS